MILRRGLRAGTLAYRPAFFLLLFLACAQIAPAVVDRNADGIGDVWGLLYPAAVAQPSADPDGDGSSNAQESSAGTDPGSSLSVIRVSQTSLEGGLLHLDFPTLMGKRYQLQRSGSLTTPEWLDVATVEPGTGGSVRVSINASTAAGKFFRVLVKDFDTDGDGVSDWEELTLGLDPTSSHTRGLSGENDLSMLEAALIAPSVITVTVQKGTASEAGLDSGTMLIQRSGGLASLNVQLAVSGSATPGVDYTSLPSTVAIPVGGRSVKLTVSPLVDQALESPESVIVTVAPHASYTVGVSAVGTVLIDDAVTANGNGLRGEYFNLSSQIGANGSPASLGTTPVLQRIDPVINFTWAVNASPSSPALTVTHDYFGSRWTGEILPQFSQIYTFFIRVNRGGRLWVGGELIVDRWLNATSGEYSGVIELQGGKRYPIVFEHYETTGDAYAQLSWQSTNQPKETVPQSRLFATVPPQIVSAREVLLLKGSGPYNYQILASGNPTQFSAANLPGGWTFNATNGLISGSPTVAGSWEIPIGASNANGFGAAVLQLRVIDTGGAITREVWSNVAGGTVAAIPTGTAPSSSGVLANLESFTDASENYGARIRGFVTAPMTGAYQFWLAADDAAELWISNDDEPVNLFKRAELTAGVGLRAWGSAAKTPLLQLESGKRYYIEILHKQGTGAGHVSVGWSKPGESVATASEVVPGYALSPFTAPSPVDGTTALYTTSMTAQGGAQTSGFGAGSLRLAADESSAIVKYNYSNLTTPVTGKHIHSGAHNGLILFDLDDAVPQADGSYVWHLEPVSPLTTQDILTVIKTGQAYINIHTANYPNGEIKGFLKFQAASEQFVPPAPTPAAPDDHSDANAASRFLLQTTFGPTSAEIARVQSLGYTGWLEEQFVKPITTHLPLVEADRNRTNPDSPTYGGNLTFNAWWQNSITADDQLRQRVAFALSEILVVSEAGVLDDRADAVSYYYDTLLTNTFGNFRDLLKSVTLTPAMGVFLDMRRNDKPNKTTGRIPNENYAREILQLFSIGLYRMHPDGSLMLNSKGEPIPTYDQDVIMGFAHAFTGWNYNQPDRAGGLLPTNFNPGSDYDMPMKLVPGNHFTGQKLILNNVVLPGLPMLGGFPLDPFASHTPAQVDSPAYQALGGQELDATHEAIFRHPNAGPFVCRQLIQRLVTSTPSRGYLYRVVRAFEDNGAGVRGDMKAVIRAILLDYEARSPLLLAQQGFGKQREPVLRVTAMARALGSAGPGLSGTYTQTNGTISVTTSTPHRLANNDVLLNFTGGTPNAAPSGAYRVTGTGANTFTVRSKDSLAGTYATSDFTYTQTDNVVTATVSNHGYVTGETAAVEFTTPAVSPPANGSYPVTVLTPNSFSFTVPDAVSRTGAGKLVDTIRVTSTAHGLNPGNAIYLRFPSEAALSKPYFIKGRNNDYFLVRVTPGLRTGTLNTVAGFLKGDYSQTGTTVTIDTSYDHGLAIGSKVLIDFAIRNGQNTTAVDGEYTVTTVDDPRRFRVTVTDTANRSGFIVAGPEAPILDRTGGTLTSTLSTFRMDSTDTDLAQTPLRAPTVFNFFEPDYQFPGTLAAAGLITPEFQLTSDTNVMRQSNFLYGGLFSGASNAGLSSFRSGGGQLWLDLGPWMGNAAGGQPWAADANLPALIDQLDTLLMGGQMTPAMETVILNYIKGPATGTKYFPMTAPTPTDSQKRDRIRAIIHLIVTSPDFTIQR